MEDHPSMNIYYYSVLNRYTNRVRYVLREQRWTIGMLEPEEILSVQTIGYCWIEAA